MNEESECKGLKLHPSGPPYFEVREIRENFITLYYLNLIKKMSK